MREKQKTYIAIDLKSFYASVECAARGLDPLDTNLVVADESRTEKTICLAVSPTLKAYGISGRPRLFEVVQRIREVNGRRRCGLKDGKFSGESCKDSELRADPSLAVSYITAEPRMSLYMQQSTRIYGIYLKFVAPEDIHVYSVDEVFIDATGYLETYGLNAHEFAMKLIREVLAETGITATAGIGTNLYLCKIAMDIVAKKMQPDQDGVRIAELDEMSYRRELWTHRPLTDFWRVGRGYAAKLEEHGLFTMGDIARCSLGKSGDYYNEDLLYRLFGVNAELLIDHAWGWEPCTIAQIKAYRPEENSISSGQVLQSPYSFEKARLIVHEMADSMALDLLDKGLVTDQIVLTVSYDPENLSRPEIAERYKGPVTVDRYGRKKPKHAHGTVNLKRRTSSSRLISEAALDLYDRITDRGLLVRRLTVAACRVEDENTRHTDWEAEGQLDLFTDYEAEERQRRKENAALEKERKAQQAMLDIRKKFGNNAVLRGLNFEEGATGAQRSAQIGGHKA